MNKVVMITGSSRGIGNAVASILYEEEYSLSLGVRNSSHIKNQFTDDSRVLIYPYEAHDVNAARKWVEATLVKFNHIDILVISAGICKPILLEKEDDELLDETFDVNVKAPYRLVCAAFSALKRSGQGRVITLASMSGKRVRNLNVGYQMSKHAVVALTHGVRRAGWDFGIRATAICPSYVATDMAASLLPDQSFEMTKPTDLAKLIVHIIELPNSASVAELLVNCTYENML